MQRYDLTCFRPMIFFLRSPRACDVGRGNSFQRQPVADTLVDDATQLLCQGNAGIAGGQRREVGNAPGNFSRPMQQTVAGYDLADHAQRFCLLDANYLLSEYERPPADRPKDFRPQGVDAGTRHNAKGKVRLILEHRVRSRDNDVRKKRIFRMDRRWSVECGNDRYRNVD